MRGLPSTISVSFANAFTLSFVRALATPRSNDFICLAVASRRSSVAISSMSSRAYQRSS